MLALQDNYESGDFEYEEKLDWEKTKKLAKIRTNLCVILQVRQVGDLRLLVPPAHTATLYRRPQSVNLMYHSWESTASHGLALA